jgi:heme oxygenase
MPSSERTCPYAIALAHDDENSSTASDGPDLIESTRQQCPAFSNNSCPFKDAHSAEQVREKLLQMPPSHYKDGQVFTKVIREMHATSLENKAPEFHLQGGCPVVQAQIDMKVVSFASAMESYSLNAIMAKLAEQHGHLHENEETAQALMNEANTDNQKVTTSEHSLSYCLKQGTAVSHQAAEDVHFVSNFAKGKIDRQLYAELVTMLYHVYVALEDCLDQTAHKNFGTCHFPNELTRVQALEDDMDFWHGTLARPPSPATLDYVDRIHHLARTEPLLLLSHAYTRYLGDLSGGRILARVAKKALDLKDNEGLAFYSFENITSAKQFKNKYRAALDALPLTELQVNQLVGEANVAFLLNMRLFEELDVKANVPGAVVRPLAEALKFREQEVVLANDEKCPFLLDQAKKGDKIKGKCPWPFILMHDPVYGMRDWKTWALLGLILCSIWSLILSKK